jgi:hypothetical protein
LELALDRGRSVFFGRSGTWQKHANREHGANEQSGKHTAADPRPGIVNVASVHQSGWRGVRELPDRICDPPPDRGAVVIALFSKLVGSPNAFHFASSP